MSDQIIGLLDPKEVDPKYRNKVIVAVLFTLASDDDDRFDKTKWHPIKKFVKDALSEDYQKSDLLGVKDVFYAMPY